MLSGQVRGSEVVLVVVTEAGVEERLSVTVKLLEILNLNLSLILVSLIEKLIHSTRTLKILRYRYAAEASLVVASQFEV